MRACAVMLMAATLLAACDHGAGGNQTASDAVPGSTGKGAAGDSASPAGSGLAGGMGASGAASSAGGSDTGRSSAALDGSSNRTSKGSVGNR